MPKFLWIPWFMKHWLNMHVQLYLEGSLSMKFISQKLLFQEIKQTIKSLVLKYLDYTIRSFILQMNKTLYTDCSIRVRYIDNLIYEKASFLSLTHTHAYICMCAHTHTHTQYSIYHMHMQLVEINFYRKIVLVV